MEDETLFSPLIDTSKLNDLLGDENVVLVDCRFSLDNPEAGKNRWMTSRIPGALYAHLDHELSSPIGDGSKGRHPLPHPRRIRQLLDAWHVHEDTLLVAYDDAGGAFAARLWWMARWMGHNGVCVLDGGWPAWVAFGGPVDETPIASWAPINAPEPADEPISHEEGWLATADELMTASTLLVDARARARYLGTEEPIDRVAGHIPGAANLPWMENLSPDGHFLPPKVLAARWQAVGGTENAVTYCGSGVTACHNILAAAAAGLALPRLYAPSWSGWISDPERPVETGKAD